MKHLVLHNAKVLESRYLTKQKHISLNFNSDLLPQYSKKTIQHFVLFGHFGIVLILFRNNSTCLFLSSTAVKFTYL